MTGLVPSKQEEVSLPRRLLPRASSLRPLAAVLLSVTRLPSGKQKWSSLSPHGSKTSFSIPLPWGGGGLTLTGRVEAPKGPTPRRCPRSSWGGRMNPDPSLQPHCAPSPAQKSGPKAVMTAPSYPVCQWREKGDLGRSFQSAKSFRSAWIMVNKE